MTLYELKKEVDENVNNGFGNFEICSFDCEGGGSYNVSVIVNEEFKEVNVYG